eukprot:11080934-Karenia_brevis.AAC.1
MKDGSSLKVVWTPQNGRVDIAKLVMVESDTKKSTQKCMIGELQAGGKENALEIMKSVGESVVAGETDIKDVYKFRDANMLGRGIMIKPKKSKGTGKGSR